MPASSAEHTNSTPTASAHNRRYMFDVCAQIDRPAKAAEALPLPLPPPSTLTHIDLWAVLRCLRAFASLSVCELPLRSARNVSLSLHMPPQLRERVRESVRENCMAATNHATSLRNQAPRQQNSKVTKRSNNFAQL